MREAIRSILEQISRGMTFDSHFVISRLIKDFSDRYLQFASAINAPSNRTLVVHGRIGREIARFEGSLISRNESISWSENIHGNASKCACWRKI